MTRPEGARGPRRIVQAALSAALAVGVAAGISACGDTEELTAPEAVARYPGIADAVAEALTAELAPLSSDGDSPQVGTSSSGCRVTGASYLSEDLLADGSAAAPSEDEIIEVTRSVLTEHGFSELASESDDPLPMRTLLSTDEHGGAMRVVIESRPDRPTLRLWWSSHVDTDGADCTDALLG